MGIIKWIFGSNNKARPAPNAQIYVERTRKCVKRYVKPALIPYESVPQRIPGQLPIHYLGLDMVTNKFWAITPPPIEVGKTPVDFWCAIHGASAPIRILIGLKTSTVKKIQIGIIVGLIIAILVVVFLVLSQVKG